MKTAKEMIEMAKCYSDEVRKKPDAYAFYEVAQALFSDEDVAFVFAAGTVAYGNTDFMTASAFQILFEGTKGEVDMLDAIVAITNTRILVIGYDKRGWTPKLRERYVSMDNINSIVVNQVHRNGNSVILLNTIGDEDFSFGYFPSATANAISSKVRELLHQYQSARRQMTQGTSGGTSKSPAEQIKEYKELLDMGIITQEEFDAKKKQLLSQ